MDAWDAFKKAVYLKDFSTERIFIGSRKSTYIPMERAHASIDSVYGLHRELKPNTAFFQKETADIRYIVSTNITYDLFVSIFDVNSNSGFFIRSSMLLSNATKANIRKYLDKFRNQNLEFRIIGMQNGYNELIDVISGLKKLVKGSLVELDLFGNEIRHIAIDLETGHSYNLLLDNRIYKPGELINSQALQSFKSTVSEIKFI
ncbi:MAG: hypothetical protein ACP5RF_01630 [Candidatus Micrarchaeia archaeon]